MFNVISLPYSRRCLAGGLLWLAAGCLGCAAHTPLPDPLATVLPAAQEQRTTASPAARDALAEGLRWIASNAPTTHIAPHPDEPAPTHEPATGDADHRRTP